MKAAFYIAKHGELLDTAIDVFTGNHGYSHCEFVFDGLYPNYSDTNSEDSKKESHDSNQDYCFSISGRDGKARFKNIDLNSGHWKLIDIKMTLEEEKELFEKMKIYEGLKYDYFGILFWYIIPIGWENPNKWWCSELMAHALELPRKEISPNDLYWELHWLDRHNKQKEREQK